MTDLDLTTWQAVTAAFAEVRSCVLSTVTPADLPHAVPVLAVWTSGAPWFSSGPRTRKAANLTRRPACVLTVAAADMDLVVEGEAEAVGDDTTLATVAEAYRDTYGWHPEVRAGRLWADGAPSAGPPPYVAYRVLPRRVFAFPTADGFRPTRFRFDDGDGRPAAEPVALP